MAVLVRKDWRNMDVSATNNPRRRSPANDHPTAHPQLRVHPQQQPYNYPLQQQPQGSWTPSIAAAPFYPSFYQNPHHQQSPQPFAAQIPQQFPHFDPANAQFAAQWAYQQMMFNAQHGFPSMQSPQHHSQQRSPPNSSSNDFFPQNQSFNPLPTATSPPHRSNTNEHPQQQQQQQQQSQQNSGFHPYRRPNRQNSHASDGSDWRPGANSLSPSPPYARPDATGSTSSISSTSSQRQRTSSNQSMHSSHNSPSANGSARGRPNGSAPSRNTPSSATSSASGPSPLRMPHHRNSSVSSSASTPTTSSSRPSALSPSMSASTTSTSSTSATAVSGASPTPRPARPSPLSQGTFTASDKRMSRDDSDLATMLESAQSSGRSSGLKGRLRRALSLNVLREDETAESSKASNSKSKSKAPAPVITTADKPGGSGDLDNGGDDGASTATVQTKKKSRTLSLFNSRLNASTDNISLSSTVSSASVMIRKLGSMGKLARRNSLAGITSLFKDKDKDGGKKGKKDKKSTAKAGASEASVSHVTAELDRASNGDWAVDLQGLSPAAKLARQHTLKTNAEAAAKAKAQQEAQAAAATAAAATPTESLKDSSMSGVPAWERGTTSRQASSPVKTDPAMANEDDTRVIEEEEEEESDEGHYTPADAGNFSIEGWNDDEDWGVDPDVEEDTIRAGLESTHIEEDAEPWAVGLRRSLERTKRPSKGILKNPGKYDQEAYFSDQQPQTRARSNSYNSHPGSSSELGPLARIPSPDPDHIDGLHRHNSHSSGHGNSFSSALQPLPFTSPSPTGMSSDSSKKLPDLPTDMTLLVTPNIPEKSIFQHPAMNSSAPALSLTMTLSPPPMPHRSATSPAKRLAFANNLSVYDTFSSAVYDRRSEPATWSRLTPALAQRIKEELNSYKMEEMEVHAASRIHTQFFV